MSQDRVLLWEKLWGEYIGKLQRLDDLQKAGRYGYQLRMPLKAIRRAADRLRDEFPEDAKELGL
jgi:hypothetical protein